jgi:hypothetical protein
MSPRFTVIDSNCERFDALHSIQRLDLPAARQLPACQEEHISLLITVSA